MADGERLAEIKARWAKAEPGPWSWYKARTLQHLNGPDGNFAQISMPIRGYPEYEANAEAIAAAPTDVAWLCEQIQLLRRDLLTLAKLAHPEPQFYNPLVVFEAQALRDRVLAGGLYV